MVGVCTAQPTLVTEKEKLPLLTLGVWDGRSHGQEAFCLISSRRYQPTWPWLWSTLLTLGVWDGRSHRVWDGRSHRVWDGRSHRQEAFCQIRMSFPRRCQPTRPWSRSTQLHPLSGRVDAAPHSHLKQRGRRLETRKRQGRSSAQVDTAPHSHLRHEHKVPEDSENSHNISSHCPSITSAGKRQRRGYAQVETAPHSHLRQRAEGLRREKAATGLCSGRLGSILSSQAEHTLVPASRA